MSLWTSLCLAPEGLLLEPVSFVTANGETLRSLAVSLRAILAEGGLTGDESVRGLLAAIIDACRRIEESALILARFRAVPLADVQAATQMLGEAYTDLLVAVRQIGEALGCSVTYWRQRTEERERYYQRILQGLFGLFRDAHPDAGR